MASFTTRISDGTARLEFNLPDEPVNKISQKVKLELESLLDSLGGQLRAEIPSAGRAWIAHGAPEAPGHPRVTGLGRT